MKQKFKILDIVQVPDGRYGQITQLSPNGAMCVVKISDRFTLQSVDDLKPTDGPVVDPKGQGRLSL